VKLNLSGVEEVFKGDFECRAVMKKLSLVLKPLLGIKKQGSEGKKFNPSNDNYLLYFNGERLPTGADLKGAEGIVKVRFDLSSFLAQDEDWFYFGVDTTFFLSHLTNWNNNGLWEVYEK
jgi:hypothetical protein